MNRGAPTPPSRSPVRSINGRIFHRPMNTRRNPQLPLLLLCLLFAACTGQGPDVVEPNGDARSQKSIVAVDVEGGSELSIVAEPDGMTRSGAYADANGAPLGRHIDGIYESDFKSLYLVHRATASISVINVETRQKRAEITGFGDSTSSLCGIAFSNLSQGWAIDYDRPFVYQFDAVSFVLVDTLPIEGRPTSVAATGDYVFVGSQLADGSGVVSIFRSNFSTFAIEKRLSYPSPVIFMEPTSSGEAMIFVSAGTPDGKPMVHSFKISTMAQTGERALNAPALTNRIGTVPEYATISSDNYLYIATADQIYRVDIGTSRLSSPPLKWLEGEFDVIGVDEWSNLLYAYERSSQSLKRLDADGNELGAVAVAGPVSAIEFVNPSQVH
jgi:hypothetical protein